MDLPILPKDPAELLAYIAAMIALGTIGYAWVRARRLVAVRAVDYDVVRGASEDLPDECETPKCVNALDGLAVNKENMTDECRDYNYEKTQKTIKNLKAAGLMAAGTALITTIFGIPAGLALISEATSLINEANHHGSRAEGHADNFAFYSGLFDYYQEKVKKYCNPSCYPDFTKPECEEMSS